MSYKPVITLYYNDSERSKQLSATFIAITGDVIQTVEAICDNEIPNIECCNYDSSIFATVYSAEVLQDEIYKCIKYNEALKNTSECVDKLTLFQSK